MAFTEPRSAATCKWTPIIAVEIVGICVALDEPAYALQPVADDRVIQWRLTLLPVKMDIRPKVEQEGRILDSWACPSNQTNME